MQPYPRTSAFWRFEHAGWQNVAQRYHSFFARLTTQAVGPLLNAVLADGGGKARLLDIATGPGYVAGAAAQRGAVVTALDFSPPMASLARQTHPDNIAFCVGDAEQLPFHDESFDVIVTNFGLLHLGRPDEALAEAYRVLRRRGRIGFTVWVKPEKAVAFGIVLRAIEAHGASKVPLPPGPPFFRFSEPEECKQALCNAGFQNPCTQEVPQAWRLQSGAELCQAMESATVRTGGLLLAQKPEALSAIRKAIESEAAHYQANGGIELPMPAILATAVKM